MPAGSRACDACRVRRTKCVGGRPCQRCATSDIACTYNLEQRKRGPRGKTVAILQDVLGTCSGSGSLPPAAVSSTPSVASGSSSLVVASPREPGPHSLASWVLSSFDLQPIQSATDAVVSPLTLGPANSELPGTPDAAQWLPLLQPCVQRPFGQAFHARANLLELFDELLGQGVHRYFQLVHSLWPVIDAKSVQERYDHKEHMYNESFAALVLCIAAIPLLLPGAEPASAGRAKTLIREATAMHNTAEQALNPTLELLSTTLLIATVLRITHGFNAYYIRSREANGIADLLELRNPQAYEAFSDSEKEVAMHMFWLMAAVERSTAILRPRDADGSSYVRPPLSIRGRLTHLLGSQRGSTLTARLEPCTRLYEAVDEHLIDCINGACSLPQCALDATSVLLVHETLESVHATPELSDVQLVDMVITRLWLHVEIWRACMTHSLLEAASACRELRIEYPVEILAQVAAAIKALPSDGIRGNARGLGNKLLAVVTIANSVLTLPNPPTKFEGVDSVAHGLLLGRQIAAVGNTLLEQPWLRWEP